jgi:hypothetical protein
MRKSKDERWKCSMDDYLLHPKKFKFSLKDL